MESVRPPVAARPFGPMRIARSRRLAALVGVAVVLVATSALVGTFSLYLRPSAMLDFGQLMFLCGFR